MILTGKEIIKELNTNIFIDPYEEKLVNPNSYNLTLHNELYVYNDNYLDMKKENSMYKLTIKPEGLLLEPNTLYLGRTVEYTKTYNYAPMLEGRSSVGRLGMQIHITAGVGDVGFCGYWTLEISVIHPLIVYPFIPVCQIMYYAIQGQPTYYVGKYQNNSGIQTSAMYKEFYND